MENEYFGVKLKNFSNSKCWIFFSPIHIQLEFLYEEIVFFILLFLLVHYQVISTPAVKLNDVHMILYLTPSAVSIYFL